MIRVIKLHCLIAALVLCSCKHENAMRPAAYMKFIETEDNGLRREITSGDFKYTFQYKPHEYIVCKEREDTQGDTSAFRTRRQELRYTVWFNVYIRPLKETDDPLRYNVSSVEDYNSRLNYFLNRASGNFHMSYGGQDSMALAGYVFENNYGLTPMDVMVVGFKIPDPLPLKDLLLTYDDELFNSNNLRVKISQSELTTPALIFN